MFNISSFLPTAIFGGNGFNFNGVNETFDGAGKVASGISALGNSLGKSNRVQIDTSDIDRRFGRRMDAMKQEQSQKIGRMRSRALKSGFALSGSAADVLSARMQNMQEKRQDLTADWNSAVQNRKEKAKTNRSSGGFGESVRELSDLFKLGDYNDVAQPTLPQPTLPQPSLPQLEDYEGPFFKNARKEKWDTLGW